MYKQFYFEDPADVEKWMRTNINYPLHELFADIIFLEFFGN